MVSFTEFAGIDQPQAQPGNAGYSDFLMQMMPMAQQQAHARNTPPMPDPMMAAGQHPSSPLGQPPMQMGVMSPQMTPPMAQMPPPPMPPQQQVTMQSPMPPQPIPQQQQAPNRGAFLAMMREGRARTAR
jgi:hypothetical protein